MRQVLTLLWLVQWLLFLHKVIPHSKRIEPKALSITKDEEDKSVDGLMVKDRAVLLKSNPNSI